MLSEDELKKLRPLDVATLAVQIGIQGNQTPENCLDQAIALIGLARQQINSAISDART